MPRTSTPSPTKPTTPAFSSPLAVQLRKAPRRGGTRGRSTPGGSSPQKITPGDSFSFQRTEPISPAAYERSLSATGVRDQLRSRDAVRFAGGSGVRALCRDTIGREFNSSRPTAASIAAEAAPRRKQQLRMTAARVKTRNGGYLTRVNAEGRLLTQADLLRNPLLQRVSAAESAQRRRDMVWVQRRRDATDSFYSSRRGDDRAANRAQPSPMKKAAHVPSPMRAQSTQPMRSPSKAMHPATSLLAGAAGASEQELLTAQALADQCLPVRRLVFTAG